MIKDKGISPFPKKHQGLMADLPKEHPAFPQGKAALKGGGWDKIINNDTTKPLWKPTAVFALLM